MYGSGCSVCSLRDTPTNAVSVSGSSRITAPCRPSPARSTGTTRGGREMRMPIAGPIGVTTSTCSVSRVRQAS
jgi:hypothetical protein